MHKIGRNKTITVFLTGEDCYALRCSYLHEGSNVISHQRIQKVLENFEFRIPPNGSHCSLVENRTLILRIDRFCNEVLAGVNEWLQDTSNTDEKINKINSMMQEYYCFIIH